MCGIVGAVNWGDREVLERMTAFQRHRGPDDHGTWDTELPDGGWIGLGNRRLAIIDLSPAGHMPMGTEDGRLWLTYNGELYNAPELRAELESRGYRFRSRSDTEVVLRILEDEGPGGVSRLEGMFAFAAVDLRPSPPGVRAGSGPTVVLARDAFGVKPLYYAWRGDRLAFASEVKSLLQLPDLDARLDPRALHRYLTLLWVPDPETLFEGVHKLPAAHVAIFRDGQLDSRAYWDVDVPPADHDFPASEDHLVERVRELVAASVRRQMVSDVPLGAFLSAGMDSSAIVSFMRDASPGPVATYTITFPRRHRVGETTLDDPAVAARTATALGCDHHEIVVEPEVADLLPRLVWHMDEPVADPAIITAFLVCRAARPSVTVLLSGVGGDEIFGGYRKYAAYRVAKLYRTIPGPLRRHVLEPAVEALPTLRGTPLKGWLRLVRKLARTGSLQPEEGFLQASTYLHEGEKEALYAPHLRAATRGIDPFAHHRRHLDRVADAHILNRMLYLDLKTFMVSLNLTYNDKMSMASSVEVRVPYLDRELVGFAFRDIPPGWKVGPGVRPVTKRLFRRALEGVVPAEVLEQPKAGFGAPHDHWLTYDLAEMVDDLLSETQIRRRGLFEPEVVRAMIADHRSGRRDRAYQLWQLLTLELWQQTFVDGASAGPSSLLTAAGRSGGPS